MPDANYSVVASPISGPNFTAVPTNLTADGFDVRTYNASDALEDKGVCFAVHALNALPPKGGTGADGWCVLNADGTQFNGFNTNGSRTGLGEYTFTFNTPMPNVYYSVSATANSNASRTCTTTNKSTNGFTLKVFDSDNAQGCSCHGGCPRKQCNPPSNRNPGAD